MATWYLIKSRLQRGFAGGLVIAVILAVLSCFLGVYQDNIDNTEQKIDDAYAALPVRVVVSDITGTRTDGLRIPDHYGMWFTEAEWKEISKKSSLHYSADGREGTLLGITNLESAPELADTEGITITYLDTLDWTGNEAGCLVSKDLYHSLIPDEKGEYLLSLQLRIHQQDEKYIAFSLPVVGTYSGSGNSVYCPWTIVSTAQVSLQNYYTLESLSATVRNNKELERLREALAEKFSSVDPTATSSNTFAVTIYDDTLRQTVNEFHANLQNLNRFLPLVIILSCLLSGTTSFLYIHTRRRELVLLRQLGMSIKKLLFTLGLEMTLYILLGCGTALLLQGIRPYPEDTLLYFDLGYSELASTIEDFRANAKMQFIVSCVTWLAAIAVFLVLFTWKERRTAGLMLSLGAGKGATAQYLWTISMIPGCLAILVGTGVSAFLLEDSLNKSYSGVQDLLGQDFSTGIQTSAELGELIVSWDAIFIAAASQLVLLCILTIVCATIISAKKPLKLMQKS